MSYGLCLVWGDLGEFLGLWGGDLLRDMQQIQSRPHIGVYI